MRSIRNKIIIGILLIFLVIIIILVSSYFLFFSGTFKKNLENNFLLRSIDYANLIEEKNALIESHVNSLSILVLNNFNYSLAKNNKSYIPTRVTMLSSYFREFLNESYTENPSVVSVYMVYSVEDFGGLNENWYIVEEKNIKEKLDDDITTYYSDNPDMQWYYHPIKTRLPEWTEVYTDAITKVPMVSYVKPIYIYESEKQEFIGILGIDMSLEGISKELYSDPIFNTSSSFLMDSNFNPISDLDIDLDVNLIEKIKQEVKKEKSGTFSFKDKTIAYFVLKNEQKLISIIPTKDLLAIARRFQLIVISIILLLIIVTVLISYVLLSKLTKGIEMLYLASKDLENGKFNTRVNLNTNDELGILGNAFNKMAEALEKTEEERAKIDKAKTEFLSITSHELRSPMTPMRAQLQMLLGEYFGKISQEQKDSLDIVLRNTERLDRIIQDFLEISRIEAARLKFNFMKVNLDSYIKQVVEEMKGFMPEKKIQFVLDIEKLPIIEVDPDRVMQVLRNLLNNAVKFSKDNGKVWIKIAVKGKFIYFIVKDNGVGIKKEDQVRLFEPFYQVGGMYDRKVGGTGLGLAICKGIIQSQNGKIWLESEYGKGTSFYFTVPFEPIKDMKPIKLLFSNAGAIEEELKKVFLEVLGPLGEKELEDLKTKGLVEGVLLDYVNELIKANVIKDGEEFKNKILLVLGSKSELKKEELKKEKKIDLIDLKKQGLIK